MAATRVSPPRHPETVAERNASPQPTQERLHNGTYAEGQADPRNYATSVRIGTFADTEVRARGQKQSQGDNLSHQR